MSNSNDILKALLKEDLVSAKELINKSLLEKLGNSLEEKLVDFAPSVFNEEKKKGEKKLSPNQERIAQLAGNKNKNDAEDFKVLRNSKKNESLGQDEEMETIAEEFEEELASLVEEIEEELGEELTEEEITELANDLLNSLNESDKEDEDEDEDEDEEDKK